MSTKTELETKIPPPLLGFVTALLMWLLAQLLPTLSMVSSNLYRVGIVVMLAGFCLDVIGLLQFRTNSTTINPLSPEKASSMVTTGLYKYSRNPMYLGLLIVLSGWALYLGNLASFACLPIFVRLITKFQILPEERILKEKFGAPYEEYLGNVRRWI
ncbi:MAG: isoprenylcysteine carboxylmethyltransferase family protein [Proteobacteria bacterium]|nr:isoprenylcysteine carboxylmethyltransferase family protein [Pseudomonadota bacterium]